MSRSLLLLLITSLCLGCAAPATHQKAPKTDPYVDGVRINTQQAEAWRKIGNDRQAAYYDARAQEYRNEYSGRKKDDTDNFWADLLFGLIFGD